MDCRNLHELNGTFVKGWGIVGNALDGQYTSKAMWEDIRKICEKERYARIHKPGNGIA